MVRAPNLKYRDPEFGSCSDHKLDLFEVVPCSTPRLRLYIANWSASCQLGFLTPSGEWSIMYVCMYYILGVDLTDTLGRLSKFRVLNYLHGHMIPFLPLEICRGVLTRQKQLYSSKYMHLWKQTYKSKSWTKSAKTKINHASQPVKSAFRQHWRERGRQG